MTQNIIELGFDYDKFSKEKQAIYDDLMQVYKIAKEINETKLNVGAGTGWAELKNQVNDLKAQIVELQNANLKYAETQQKANAEAARAAVESQKNTESKKKETAETTKLSETQSKYIDGADQLQKILAKNEIALKMLAVSKKQLSDAFKEDIITQEQYEEALAKVNTEILYFKTSSQAVTLGLKNIEKAAQAGEGSLNQMRAQLNLMIYTQDQMTESTEEDIALKKEMGEAITQLTKEITEQENAQGKFGRNVGNYANSMAEGFEKVRSEIARLKGEQEQLMNLRETDPAGFSSRGGEGEIEKTTRAISDLEKVQQISLKTNQNFSTTLKGLTREYMNMASSGNVSKEFLEEFQKDLTALTIESKNLKSEMRALASETRGLDLMAGGINTLVGSFELAAGAFGLLNIESENAHKITAKLVAVQTVANGVMHLAKEFTEKSTLAGKAYAFVQGLITTATDKTAASTARLNAALGLIGLAVTIIGALVIAYSMYSKSSSEAARSQEAFNKATEKAIEKEGDRIAQLQMLIDKIKKGGLTQQEKTETLKDYNEKLGDTLGKYKTYQELEDAMIANGPKYIAYLLSKARAEAAYGMVVEEYKKRFEKEKADAKDFTGFSLLGLIFDDESTHNKNKADALKRADDDIKVMSGMFSKADEEMKKLQNELNIPDPTGDKDKKGGGGSREKAYDPTADIIKNAEQKRKIVYESEVKIIEQSASLEKEKLENEKLSFAERLQAAQRFYDLSLELINKEKKFQLEELKFAEAEEMRMADEKAKGRGGAVTDPEKLEKLKQSIIEKYAASRRKLELNTNSEIIKINGDSERAITAIQKSEIEKRQAHKAAEAQHQKDLAEIKINSIQNEYDQQLVDLDANYTAIQERDKYNNKKLAENQKEYAKEKLRLTYERDSKILEQQIKFAEAELEVQKALAELETDPDKKQAMLDNISKAEGMITSMKVKLQSLGDTFKKAFSADTTKSFSEGLKEWASDFANIAGMMQTTMSFIGGLFDANIVKQKNGIQDLINKNEEYGNKELERIMGSTLSEQDKAAKVIQLKAEVDAKNTIYARKQKELDIKKAQFDKASAIANIILNTAVSISKVLFNPFQVALAATLGALQLAVAVATPIPTYAKGTDYHPGGLARYGEAGAEKVILPDGKSFIADQDTTGYLPKGTKVIPLTSDAINDAMYGSMVQNTADRIAIMEQLERRGNSDTAWKIAKWQADQTKKALEANNKKQPININNKIDFGWADYVNKNVRGIK